MTLIRIGLENGAEGRNIAWALDYPGCFAYGQDAAEAIVNIAPALLKHQQWVESHTDSSWLGDLSQVDFRLVDVWDVYDVNEQYEVVPSGQGYEINAWFRDDWRPLRAEEIEHGLEMLSWSRADLLDLLSDVPGGLMDYKQSVERRSIRGILEHVATAEWWYLDRLELAGVRRADLPEDVFERLSVVRNRLIEVLPTLQDREDRVTGKDGQFWSPRKLLRRALWHEKDHIGHISRLILEGM